MTKRGTCDIIFRSAKDSRFKGNSFTLPAEVFINDIFLIILICVPVEEVKFSCRHFYQEVKTNAKRKDS